MIRPRNGEWVLLTEDGSKVLGRHKTKKEAKKQEYAIRMSEKREKKKK